jgi:hypothetical protein
MTTATRPLARPLDTVADLNGTPTWAVCASDAITSRPGAAEAGIGRDSSAATAPHREATPQCHAVVADWRSERPLRRASQCFPCDGAFVRSRFGARGRARSGLE